VQFFNGVGVSTHKEHALALVIDKGVSCLSFHLEDEENLFLMDILENYSVTRRKPGES
jgi:hypothetical protein